MFIVRMYKYKVSCSIAHWNVLNWTKLRLAAGHQVPCDKGELTTEPRGLGDSSARSWIARSVEPQKNLKAVQELLGSA